MSLMLIIFSHVFVAWKRFELGDLRAPLESWPLPLRFLLNNGEASVQIFFGLSGFIISYAFARGYAKGRSLSLKNFYLRRLVRIEPPYFIISTLFLLLYLLKGWHHIHYYGPHYLASIFYVHNLVFPRINGLNDVTWTLEVEIQFYLLAPLLCHVFRLKQGLRTGIMIAATTILIILPYYFKPHFVSLYNYAGYFLVGMLIADLTVNGKAFLERFKWPVRILTAVSLYTLLFGSYMPWNIYMMSTGVILFFVGYGVLNIPFWKRFFSFGIFPVLGGMSYSIYLFHNLFITFLFLYGVYIPGKSIAMLLLNMLWISIAIFVVGAAIFRIFEKPFMNLSARIPVFIDRKKAVPSTDETAS